MTFRTFGTTGKTLSNIMYTKTRSPLTGKRVFSIYTYFHQFFAAEGGVGDECAGI